MKVGKEQIAGLAVALREFVARDHEAEAVELGAWLESLQGSPRTRPGTVRDRPALLPATRDRRRRPSGGPRCSRSDSPPASRAIVVPHAPLARGELVDLPRGDHRRRTGRASSAPLAALRDLIGDSWTLAGATVVDGTGVGRGARRTS